jgi:MFS family permease
MPRWLISVFILTFGYSLTGPMRDPLLVDRGFSLDELSKINGLIYPFVGILAVGAIPFISRRFKIDRLLRIVLVVAIVHNTLFVPLAFTEMPKLYVYCWSALGSFISPITLVVFGSITLSLARPSRAAIDIATLATTPALASAIAGVIGGIIAGGFGYPALFVGSLFIKLAGTLIMVVNYDFIRYFSNEKRPVAEELLEGGAEPAQG